MITNMQNILRNLPLPMIAFLLMCGFLFSGVCPVEADESKKATIAVLSHTDFLPDSTGVYDRRSWHGRDKNPNFAANNDLRTDSDQAYDNITRTSGYAPESVGLPEILADGILEQLTKSKRFIPVERKSLRTAVLEQRFGKKITENYMSRTLDKAIQNMDKLEAGRGIATETVISGANYNDLLHDFKDLGSAIGANFLVLGNLQQLGSTVESKAVPFSESGRTVTQKTAEARLRLRIIDAASSTVVGADSLHLNVSHMLFKGGKENRDDFQFLEQVSKNAANKILDIVFPAKVVSLMPMVISRGANDGIVVGDQFSILREGKEIKETSGAVIARLKSKIGQVRVSKVQHTVAAVDVEMGGEIKSGDLAVRLISKPDSTVATTGQIPLTLKQVGTAETLLPRVAIGLVKADSTAKTGTDSGKHVPTFTDSIISRLVQSKRFTVIDRQEVDQLLAEQTAQAIAENKDLPSAMGSLKGCNYLVIGSLQNFSIEEQAIKLPNSSRVMEVVDGFAEGNVRLVDASTGDIIESRKISVQKQLDTDAGEDRLIAALADSFAAQVVANLLNAVYPIKVAAVEPDGTVYINRGTDGLLDNGSLFSVMQTGDKVMDPNTGIELGVVEKNIGKVQLLSVAENLSIGKIIEGAGAQVGDVLKLVRSGGKITGGIAAKRSGGYLPGASALTQLQSSETNPQSRGKATLALAKISLNSQVKYNKNSKTSVIQDGTMDRLSDIMVDSLSKSKRFVMMERREVDKVIDEKMFQAVSQGADIRSYLKELQGSDYLVVGELTNAYIHISKRKVPYLDEEQVDYIGLMEGNNRIVDNHTSEVVASEKIRIKKKFKNLELEEIRTKLVDQYALEAADRIIQQIYPTRVLGVMPDGTVFVNRGADGNLQIGSTFSVERPGQALVDKDTGIQFGTAEIPVGKIEITSVESARSRARVVGGEIPLAGDILRNIKGPKKPVPKVKREVFSNKSKSDNDITSAFDTSTIRTIPAQTEIDTDTKSKYIINETNSNYHALIIGNNAYRGMPKLKTAVKDAQDIERLLREKYNFNTLLLINSERAEILNGIAFFRNTLKKEDNLLIYYAGHGWLDESADEGYWLPSNAAVDNMGNWISNTTVTSQLRAIQANHVLVVSDSCYSGKLTRSIGIQGINMRGSGSASKELEHYTKLLQKKSRTALTSGGLEPVSDRGENSNSIFAYAFLRALSDNNGYLDGQGLLKNIMQPVILNSDQTPEYSEIKKAGHLGGDFVFIVPKNG